MFEFFGVGRSKTERRDTAGPQTLPPTQPKQLLATQREMVRLTLHHACKRHGIPIAWLNAELFIRLGLDGGEIVCLQLTVQKWHDALMLYAPALQKELLDGFQRFDHSAGAARYDVSWRFANDCGCPHSALPEAAFWTNPTVASSALMPAGPVTSAVAPTSMLHVAASVSQPTVWASPVVTVQPASAAAKFDLPRTQMDAEDTVSTGFAPTQINDPR